MHVNAMARVARPLSVVALFALVGCVEYEVKPSVGGEVDGPIIAVSPESVAFGALEAGEESSEVITINNLGNATLYLSGLELDGPAVFTLTRGHMIDEIAPGDYTEFKVTYTSEGSAEVGTINITSDDPTTPESLVELSSGAVDDGVVDPEAPVAVCEANPSTVSTHATKPDWIGEDSYDPNGGSIVKYTWSLLSQPAGSVAAIPAGSATSPNRNDFAWDLAGEYVAQLVVQNDAGVNSSPCEAVLTAEPSDDFWIEMYWEHAHDDMDLHLLKPSGTLETNGDCYFMNCVGRGLEWGASGSDDNPSLDLDDIPGTGPENIRIASPASGTYSVYVHDYPGSEYRSDNDVTVSIYVGGALAWKDTRTITGEDAHVEFATVTFPDGTVSDAR